MTGKKYNIALIGAGRMGERWAEVINNFSSTKLTVVVDPDKQAGERVASKYGAIYKPEFPGECANIDAFFIVTPHAYLSKNAIRALAFDKPVFLEKPGARNASELKTLVNLAKKKHLPLMIGFNYRYFDAIAIAKKKLEAGTIGEILFLRLRHGHQGRVGYKKEWRMDKKLAGGGVLMDQGVHLIDLIFWLMPGSIRKLSAVAQNSFYNGSVEEHASLILKNKKGQTASMSVGITEWKPIFSMEIIGTKGFLLVEGLGRKYGGSETLTIGLKDKNGNVSEEVIKCDSEPKNALEALLSEFIKTIKTGKESGPTGKDALNVLNVVGRTYDALKRK